MHRRRMYKYAASCPPDLFAWYSLIDSTPCCENDCLHSNYITAQSVWIKDLEPLSIHGTFDHCRVTSMFPHSTLSRHSIIIRTSKVQLISNEILILLCLCRCHLYTCSQVLCGNDSATLRCRDLGSSSTLNSGFKYY
jgi:hypothetical protein